MITNAVMSNIYIQTLPSTKQHKQKKSTFPKSIFLIFDIFYMFETGGSSSGRRFYVQV